MSRRVLPLLAVAAVATSCSLLIPLDYTGGTEPARASRGGQSGTGGLEAGGLAGEGLGGTLGEAGMNEGGQAGAIPPEGGVGNEAATGGTTGGTLPSTGGDTSAGTGGSATGGDTGMGGTGGLGGGGTGGIDATGGMESGGGGGTPNGGMSGGGGNGGRAGRPAGGRGGMGGMLGGMSGSGVAGNGDCGGADLRTDPLNCGSCGNACDAGQECAGGLCISSPCEGICATWTPADQNGAHDGPRKDDFGTVGDVCVQVDSYDPNPGYLPAFNCWNTATRSVQLNGVTMACGQGSKAFNVPKRAGGYCVHATPGTQSYAGFLMPYAPSDCCLAPQGGAGGH